MIPDDGGRPQHVGSVINKYVLIVKFVGSPYNSLGYFRKLLQCITKTRSFWAVTPYAMLYKYRRFGESYLHPQNSPTNWTTLKMEVEIFTEFWSHVYQTTRHRIPDQHENCDVLFVFISGVAYFYLHVRLVSLKCSISRSTIDVKKA